MTRISMMMTLALASACGAGGDGPGPGDDDDDAAADAMLEEPDGQIVCRGAECLEPDAGPEGSPDAAPPALQLGDDCELFSDRCAPELTCVYTVGRFQCQPHGDVPQDGECESLIGDCDRGMACVSAGPTKFCRRWCETDAAAAWCAPEQICGAYVPNADYPANTGTCS